MYLLTSDLLWHMCTCTLLFLFLDTVYLWTERYINAKGKIKRPITRVRGWATLWFEKYETDCRADGRFAIPRRMWVATINLVYIAALYNTRINVPLLTPLLTFWHWYVHILIFNTIGPVWYNFPDESSMEIDELPLLKQASYKNHWRCITFYVLWCIAWYESSTFCFWVASQILLL